jgi:hypothetical protein
MTTHAGSNSMQQAIGQTWEYTFVHEHYIIMAKQACQSAQLTGIARNTEFHSLAPPAIKAPARVILT